MEFVVFTMTQAMAFVAVSLALILFSRRSLKNLRCHGFYRFFVFEGILALFIINLPYWMADEYSFTGLLSMLLLFLSLLFVFLGFYLLKSEGGKRDDDINTENFEFENTSVLITKGIYHYVRHPMYSSLLLLAWGTLLKNITLTGLVLALVVSVFLILTAKFEEHENIAFFGADYQDYMLKSKRFIPFIY